MPFILDPEKWAKIESLPLPTGVGDLDTGLCAVARIVYACTGTVSDLADATCIAPTLRSYMVRLNDRMPKALRGQLGTLEIANRVLAANTSCEAEQRRAFLCADAAVRVFAVSALQSVKMLKEADTLARLRPITDKAAATAAAYAARDAAKGATNATYAAAYATTYTAATYAAYATTYAADAAAAATTYAAYAAAAAAAAAYAAACAAATVRVAACAAATVRVAAIYAADADTWEPAFLLLDAMLEV